MTAERAIELLSGGTRVPAVPYSADELDEACRMACDALRLYSQSFQREYSLNAATAEKLGRETPKTRLSVKTPLGDIVAEASTDPDNPGVWVSLHQDGEDYEPTLALVEYTADEGDMSKSALITRVWRDTEQDEYTDRVVHTGLEKGGAE